MSFYLLIPVENQVRELDPKLLLATCAAKAGIKSYIGYRTEMDINIARFPRGIYLAKSFTQRSDKMFRILSKLGFIICAWDEEALVHYPPDIYFKRRLSATALSYVSHLFAWGQDNEDLFKSYPSMPRGMPIHKVGNPRLDMLRKDFSYYYDDEICNIKSSYGKFILINTNFGNVNAHLPIHNLFTSRDSHGNYTEMGRGATGMGREFSLGRAKYKQRILDHFLEAIPKLARKFPDTTIVIRPHPVENKSIYHQLASRFDNLKVVQEGNVIPWIRAATAVIHNGCTTGIEAYLSGKPALAYVPLEDVRFGYDALIPNELSFKCQDIAQLEQATSNLLNHGSHTVNSTIIKKYIEFDDDQLCSIKITNKLEEIFAGNHPDISWDTRITGTLLANKRRLIKRIKGLSPKSKYHRCFQSVRFPTLDEDVLQRKVDKFAQIINCHDSIKIKQVSPHIFLVQ